MRVTIGFLWIVCQLGMPAGESKAAPCMTIRNL